MRRRLTEIKNRFNLYNYVDDWTLYKNLTSVYKQLTRAKKSINKDSIMSSENKSEASWGIVNHERMKTKLNQPNNDISPNEFNDFFVGISGNIINSLPNLLEADVQHYKTFFLKPITLDKILEMVSALKTSKCLDAYCLNSNIPIILVPLTDLMNLILPTCIFQYIEDH
ncbi:hypothetical protein JTB14_012857 [Gonioctena quinquepunctata]|nr:hypothetical protein JTB14_012857 [Gonioctena quinquepunctata]